MLHKPEALDILELPVSHLLTSILTEQFVVHVHLTTLIIALLNPVDNYAVTWSIMALCVTDSGIKCFVFLLHNLHSSWFANLRMNRGHSVFMVPLWCQCFLPCAESLALPTVKADAGSETVAVLGLLTSVVNDVVQKHLETKRSYDTKRTTRYMPYFYDTL